MTIVPRGLWAFMLFAAFAGCASYDQQPMPTLPATGIQHLKWQGLELSLWQPDAASVKRTFNLDLRAEAILTEFVKAENRSPHDASISPNAMQLSSGTRTYSCLTPDQVAGRLAFSPSERYFVWALGLPLVGIIPGIIDGSNAVDANHLMREDLIEKALKNQIFRSGAKTSGFVFFDVPRTATPDTLTIPVTIEPGQVHGFRFLLPPSADLP
ncbi:MAG TPA: hypothetical protein VNF29_04775 [Candidatus Binataceae bacterium]|nr:hypothetical protein [Candidatus Binataceae bacterium]